MPYVSSALTAGDDAATYTGKIVESAIASLRALPAQLPASLVERVVDLLLDARRVFFFGLGVSSTVAQDAEHHFFRFALPVTAHEDVLMQRMYAASAADGRPLFHDFTHRQNPGHHRCRQAGRAARSDRCCAYRRRVATGRLSDCAIELELREDTDAYMPMTSRLAHLAVLDVLAAGVTLRRGEALQPHLRAIKESLRDTRLSHTPASESNTA
jgi:RpiR family carbohydrate utilization transcriptional regulator